MIEPLTHLAILIMLGVSVAALAAIVVFFGTILLLALSRP